MAPGFALLMLAPLGSVRGRLASELLLLFRGALPPRFGSDHLGRASTAHNDDMKDEEGRNVATVRKYLAALQRGEAGEKLREFFTEDVRQVEMPNQLNNRGQENDIEHILERSLQGLRILQHQEYEIVSAVAQEDRVAVEARWAGTLAVPLGKMEAGAQMGASFANVLSIS